jgi:hypothetical protein
MTLSRFSRMTATESIFTNNSRFSRMTATEPIFTNNSQFSRMTATEPIFTKLRLPRRFCTEFHVNADTRLRTDGWTDRETDGQTDRRRWFPQSILFYFVISFYLHKFQNSISLHVISVSSDDPLWLFLPVCVRKHSLFHKHPSLGRMYLPGGPRGVASGECWLWQ